MDAVSLKKRSNDGICRLALNQPARSEQRASQRSHIDCLRKEQSIAKEWHAQLKQDAVEQKHNIKCMHKAIKQSYDFGGPHYGHNVPTAGQERPQAYATALNGLAQSTGAIHAAKQSQRKLDDVAKTELINSTGKIQSFAEWFERYGEPSRKPHATEYCRSLPSRPRNIPFEGRSSSAIHLRLGNAIWNDKSALRTLSRPPIGLDLVEGVAPLPPRPVIRETAAF